MGNGQALNWLCKQGTDCGGILNLETASFNGLKSSKRLYVDMYSMSGNRYWYQFNAEGHLEWSWIRYHCSAYLSQLGFSHIHCLQEARFSLQGDPLTDIYRSSVPGPVLQRSWTPETTTKENLTIGEPDPPEIDAEFQK